MKNAIQKLISNLKEKPLKQHYDAGVLAHLEAALKFIDAGDRHAQHLEKRKKGLMEHNKNIADLKKEKKSVVDDKIKGKSTVKDAPHDIA